MSSFADSVLENIDFTLTEINEEIKDTFTTFASYCVERTPQPSMQPERAKFSKGLLSNNWFPSFDTESLSTTPAVSDRGADSLTRLENFKTFKIPLYRDYTMYLNNNIDYAVQADEIGWTRTANYDMTNWAYTKVKAEKGS